MCSGETNPRRRVLNGVAQPLEGSCLVKSFFAVAIIGLLCGVSLSGCLVAAAGAGAGAGYVAADNAKDHQAPPSAPATSGNGTATH